MLPIVSRIHPLAHPRPHCPRNIPNPSRRYHPSNPPPRRNNVILPHGSPTLVRESDRAAPSATYCSRCRPSHGNRRPHKRWERHFPSVSPRVSSVSPSHGLSSGQDPPYWLPSRLYRYLSYGGGNLIREQKCLHRLRWGKQGEGTANNSRNHRWWLWREELPIFPLQV